MSDRRSQTGQGGEALGRILEAVAEALGGRDRLRAVQAFHAAGTTTFVTAGPVHICGHWRCWCRTSTASCREEINIAGGIRFERVLKTAQGTGWKHGPNDQAMPLADQDLADLTGLAFLLSGSWLFANRIGGEIRILEDVPSRKTQLLECLPKGGTAFTVRLKNSLPEEIAWSSTPAQDPLLQHVRYTRPIAEKLAGPELDAQSGDGASSPLIRFLDWAEMDGISVPSRFEEVSNPAQKKVFRISRFEVNPTIPEGFFEKPEPMRPRVRFPAGRQSVKLPFRFAEHRTIVDVQVDGQGPYPFFLDTGTSSSLMDRGLARRLGLKTLCKFSGNLGGGQGVTRVDLVQGVDLLIGDLAIRPRNLMVIDIDAIARRAAGLSIYGILGGSFIQNFVVDLDYEKREVTFFNPASHSWAGKAHRIKIVVPSGVPFVEMQSSPPQGVRQAMMVDTGADMCLLFTKPFVEQQGLLEKVSPSISTVTFGIAGELEMQVGRLAEALLGPIRIERPLAALALQSKGTLGQAGFAGILGGQVLSRFKVRLDYGTGWMSLDPLPHSNLPYGFDESGLVLVGKPPAYLSFEVVFVVEGSPAAQAGLQKSDEIVSIDGRPSREVLLPDLTAALRESGRTFELGVRRGGKLLSLRFVTRELI